jgi:hypothetical protein
LHWSTALSRCLDLLLLLPPPPPPPPPTQQQQQQQRPNSSGNLSAAAATSARVVGRTTLKIGRHALLSVYSIIVECRPAVRLPGSMRTATTTAKQGQLVAHSEQFFSRNVRLLKSRRPLI